jgi:AcrR family transcriptional regulator
MTQDSKLDRRVVRTRQLLSKALMELILEKGYDTVTVKDITDRANVGRATFYLHYEGGKEELLLSNLEVIYEELLLRIKELKRDPFISRENRPSRVAFQHAAEHQDLYLILLRGQGATALAQRIREYLAGLIQQELLPYQEDNGAPAEIAANFMAGSLISLITWWLEHDMPYSAEYMADMFSRLTVPGVEAVVGVVPG